MLKKNKPPNIWSYLENAISPTDFVLSGTKVHFDKAHSMNCK